MRVVARIEDKGTTGAAFPQIRPQVGNEVGNEIQGKRKGASFLSQPLGITW
jgi:hypothetical protein